MASNAFSGGNLDVLTPASMDRMMSDEHEARMQVMRRLETTAIEKALRSGEVLGPLRLVGCDSKRQYLETSAFYSRFRRGDRVQLRIRKGKKGSEDICETSVKDVLYPSEGRLQVAIAQTRKVELNGRTDYFVYPTENELMLEKLRFAINEVTEVLNDDRRSVKLDSQPIKFSSFETLNDSQKEAFRYLAFLDGDGAVQGPPGTGKTQLLQVIVQQALQCGLTIGMAAFTHSAVDNALSRIALLGEGYKFCRVGRPEVINSDSYSPGWLKGRKSRSFSQTQDGICLYAATLHSWALSPSAPIVDLMIVDEAGQVPIFYIPVLLAKSRKLFALGDHRQLPLVLQGDHSDTVPANDAFSCLLRTTSPMLTVQYRMNSTIQEWPSERFYGGRLIPDAANAHRDILVDFKDPAVHLGDGPLNLKIHDDAGDEQANLSEASLVANLVGSLAKAYEFLKVSQIGIISPRRMQNGAIINALQQKFGVEKASMVQVDTVERFQGQQREVIVFSFGSGLQKSSSEDVSFVSDARRLNVAVTRARSRLYCFASRDLFEVDKSGACDGTVSDLSSFFSSFENDGESRRD